MYKRAWFWSIPFVYPSCLPCFPLAPDSSNLSLFSRSIADEIYWCGVGVRSGSGGDTNNNSGMAVALKLFSENGNIWTKQANQLLGNKCRERSEALFSFSAPRSPSLSLSFRIIHTFSFPPLFIFGSSNALLPYKIRFTWNCASAPAPKPYTNVCMKTRNFIRVKVVVVTHTLYYSGVVSSHWKRFPDPEPKFHCHCHCFSLLELLLPGRAWFIAMIRGSGWYKEVYILRLFLFPPYFSLTQRSSTSSRSHIKRT